ncbi:MAG: Crp/Fnr family transcriptional regulator [Phaeodactylibacter sp.]|nr:Crp/Fnr family transcriptional regulator [Phaeodactylibacter sp.]
MDLKEKVRAVLRSSDALSKEEIELIVETTIVEAFEKGDFLLKEGQIPEKCYMVVEGCVREYLLVDGEEKSTAFYTEGDKIAAYTNDGKNVPSRHYWECSEDCVLTISDQLFEDDLRRLIPRLDAIIQQVAMEKLNQAKEEWSEFVSSSPEERYLHLLETRPSLLNRVPHHQIASYLGMKPQSLSRIRKRILEKKKQGVE